MSIFHGNPNISSSSSRDDGKENGKYYSGFKDVIYYHTGGETRGIEVGK